MPAPIPTTTVPTAPSEIDRVYVQLREALMDGLLPPGQFLSEADLAQRCATSRTPVREACMRLHQDGWLTRFPKKGFLVTPISARDIVDLYQFRKILEGFTVERAAQSAGPEALATLRQLLAPERNPEADTRERVRANEAFHLHLATLAGNRRVKKQLELTLAFCRRLDSLYMAQDPTWIPHDDLLEALERHHRVEARDAMLAHLDHCQDCLITLFGG